MRFSVFRNIVIILFLALLRMPICAQDTNLVRMKCTQFGFKENTKDHDECIKQFLKASRSKVTTKPDAPIKPNAAPASPVFTEAQLEEEYWRNIKKIDNKESYEAYLNKYPIGRFANLARAQLSLMQEKLSGQQKPQTDRSAEASGNAKANDNVSQGNDPSLTYGVKVAASIQPNIYSIKELSASLTTEYDVYTDASGKVISAKIRKRSGDAYWDDAALHAILKTERLPLDETGRVPSPMTISLRPSALDGAAKIAPKMSLVVGRFNETETLEDYQRRKIIEIEKIEQESLLKNKRAELAGFPFQRTIYFDIDSSLIDPEYQSILRENAKVLISNNRYRLSIEGHADGLGGREYGVALGQKRSEVVRKELVLYGAPESQLESVSFGKERPAVMGDDVYSMAKNRRVELVVR